jgi:hypothetical protein
MIHVTRAGWDPDQEEKQINVVGKRRMLNGYCMIGVALRDWTRGPAPVPRTGDIRQTLQYLRGRRASTRRFKSEIAPETLDDPSLHFDLRCTSHDRVL